MGSEHKHTPGVPCSSCEQAASMAQTTFNRENASDIPTGNSIKGYIACGLCLAEKPADQSSAEWARLEAGVTPIGFQVRCVRHDVNILHMDFDGFKPRMNSRP